MAAGRTAHVAGLKDKLHTEEVLSRDFFKQHSQKTSNRVFHEWVALGDPLDGNYHTSDLQDFSDAIDVPLTWETIEEAAASLPPNHNICPIQRAHIALARSMPSTRTPSPGTPSPAGVISDEEPLACLVPDTSGSSSISPQIEYTPETGSASQNHASSSKSEHSKDDLSNGQNHGHGALGPPAQTSDVPEAEIDLPSREYDLVGVFSWDEASEIPIPRTNQEPVLDLDGNGDLSWLGRSDQPFGTPEPDPLSLQHETDIWATYETCFEYLAH
jgi:hypothetical protein